MDKQASYLTRMAAATAGGQTCGAQEADIEYELFTLSHILTALQRLSREEFSCIHIYILKKKNNQRKKSTKCLDRNHTRPPQGLESEGRLAPRASSADVPARVPHFCAWLHLQNVKEGMLEGFSQGDALGGLILQHALDEVEEAVMVLSFRGQVSLQGVEGEVRVLRMLPKLES